MPAFGSRLMMVSRHEDPLELANQEAEFEEIEANLADRLAEIEHRKQKIRREWDTNLQKLTLLAKSIANPTISEAIRRFSQTTISRTEKLPERNRADAARRAALILRKEAINAEEAFLIQSDAQLADIEEKLIALKETFDNTYTRDNSSDKAISSTVEHPSCQNISSTEVLIQNEVQVFTQSSSFSGFISCLSEKEVFVATCTIIPFGTEVRLEFNAIHKTKILTYGIVRWTRELNENKPNDFPGLGIEFINLTPEIREALQNLVSIYFS